MGPPIVTNEFNLNILQHVYLHLPLPKLQDFAHLHSLLESVQFDPQGKKTQSVTQLNLINLFDRWAPIGPTFSIACEIFHPNTCAQSLKTEMVKSDFAYFLLAHEIGNKKVYRGSAIQCKWPWRLFSLNSIFSWQQKRSKHCIIVYTGLNGTGSSPTLRPI